VSLVFNHFIPVCKRLYRSNRDEKEEEKINRERKGIGRDW
jgi:hypothetical protein